MPSKIYKYNLVLLLLLNVFIGSIAVISNEDKLTRFLFNKTRYSPMYRPVLNDTAPLLVHHVLYLLMISDVDEKNMILTTSVRIKMMWKDEFLTWEPGDYGGMKEINPEPTSIWTPSIILYNKAQSNLDYDKPRANLKHDGSVSWLFAMVIKSSCLIHVQYFPFDEQVCELFFGSWNYDVTKLDLQPKSREEMLYDYHLNGEWELMEASSRRTTVVHICCKNDVARITYHLHLKRRTLFYMTNFILPCAIIAFLTLLVFLTPIESGERMAVGVTILLSMAVFFLMLESTMPSSNELPLLAKYYCCTVIEVVCCMVAMCWILRLVHHDPKPLAKWLKKAVLRYLASFVFYKTGHRIRPRKIEVQENTVQRDAEIETKFAGKWLKKLKQKGGKSQVNQESNAEENKAINILSVKVREEVNNEKLKEQWVTVANVLNRFFTCLFLFAAVMTMLAIFVFITPIHDFH
ncbi:neuronal acetylcholine receptor subunit alpha-7 [Exaiptasia diaphana]|uniref:Uncharacterized protein n=1 Tax=Exaiptasia diaphana TaxID=2652724 RepID=A0A913XGF6_EXADI|nr:neuronal acetylcholine receptor subunit alpha-7 [Exaiptasia diaphana]